MDQEHSQLRASALNGPSPWGTFSHLSTGLIPSPSSHYHSNVIISMEPTQTPLFQIATHITLPLSTLNHPLSSYFSFCSRTLLPSKHTIYQAYSLLSVSLPLECKLFKSWDLCLFLTVFRELRIVPGT